jgi:hypothetical protein
VNWSTVREQRDLDWFIEVTNQAEWPRLRSATATDRDYLRLLALYKLGVVIEATADTPPGIIIMPAVDALMESLESLVLADLLPESPSMEQIIEEAWKAGLTPEPVAADEVRKAQSQAVRRAADARHASNRAAKTKGPGTVRFEHLPHQGRGLPHHRRAGLQGTGHDQELDRGHSKGLAAQVISLRTFTLRAA